MELFDLADRTGFAVFASVRIVGGGSFSRNIPPGERRVNRSRGRRYRTSLRPILRLSNRCSVKAAGK